MFHMIQLLKCFNTRKRIELPATFFANTLWWQTFAEDFNGYADFFDPVANTFELFTDACLTGLAAICQKDFYNAKVVEGDGDDIYYTCITPKVYAVTVPKVHVANINVLVLSAILLALIHWNTVLINCRVLCYCDNLQVCYNLCKDKTKNPLSNECLRLIFWICVTNNIFISPAYIPSIMNDDADYLSRLSKNSVNISC